MTSRLRNLELARLLGEVAVLLEIQGENPFRVRAYRRAAEAISMLSEDVADLVAEDRLESVKGIGKGLAGAIREWVETGQLSVREELIQQVPPGLVELLNLPGVGPKTAAILHRELGIDGIDALKEALAHDRLRGVKGIGPKTVDNLRRALAAEEMRQGRFPAAVALPAAEQLKRALAEHPAARAVEVAGSLRRGRDTVGDIDIVAATDDAEALMAHFVTLPGVRETLQRGPTKSRVRLYNDMEADLRAVEPAAFASALHHFTGSQAHNVRLREWARRRGMSLNEYGILVLENDRLEQPESEEALYRRLGLAYIPPELREDRGEIERAAAGPLPRLVELGDLQGDLHVHSHWSDGQLALEDIAAEAQRRGWRYVAVTDHSPSLRMTGGLSPERVREQGRAIDGVQERFPDVRILKGIEVDILADGSLDLPDDVLTELDIVIASVHSRFQMDEEEMTRRIVQAMEHPHVHIIAHPTGRLIGRRDPYAVRMDVLLEAAVRTGTALEINSSLERLDLKDEHVRQAMEAGALLAVNSDTHREGDFDQLAYGVKVARRGWAEPHRIINTWDWPKLRDWLQRKD